MNASNLALADDDLQNGQEISKFLTASIGKQLMGIDAVHVRDVIKNQDMTRVPLSSDKIEGILNLRGHIVTVINVRRCLGLHSPVADSATDEPQMCVVIEQDKELFGLLVDRVRDVLDLKGNEIEANPPTLDPVWASSAKGVFCLDEGLLVILDVSRLVASLKPQQSGNF